METVTILEGIGRNRYNPQTLEGCTYDLARKISELSGYFGQNQVAGLLGEFYEYQILKELMNQGLIPYQSDDELSGKFSFGKAFRKMPQMRALKSFSHIKLPKLPKFGNPFKSFTKVGKNFERAAKAAGRSVQSILDTPGNVLDQVSQILNPQSMMDSGVPQDASQDVADDSSGGNREYVDEDGNPVGPDDYSDYETSSGEELSGFLEMLLPLLPGLAPMASNLLDSVTGKAKAVQQTGQQYVDRAKGYASQFQRPKKRIVVVRRKASPSMGLSARPPGSVQMSDGVVPYTVKAGETFATIAAKIYGDPMRWNDILQLTPAKARLLYYKNGIPFVPLYAGETINVPAIYGDHGGAGATGDWPVNPADSHVPSAVLNDIQNTADILHNEIVGPMPTNNVIPNTNTVMPGRQNQNQSEQGGFFAKNWKWLVLIAIAVAVFFYFEKGKKRRK